MICQAEQYLLRIKMSVQQTHNALYEIVYITRLSIPDMSYCHVQL